MITEAELMEMERRAEAAQQAPWEARFEGIHHWSGSHYIRTGRPPEEEGHALEIIGGREADYVFIASARTDLPRLVAEIRRLKALLGASQDP